MKLALVGYGRIAPRHLEVFRALGCEIVAACNRSPEGRERAENEGGIARTYARAEEMMERERPEAVLCLASFRTIREAALSLMPFGAPMLLEKPPGTSLDQLDELEATAARHRTPVMVALNRRFYSVVQRAIEDAGGPSAITAVSVQWSEAPQQFRARGIGAEQIADLVFANSLHGLDLLTLLAGPVRSPAVVGRDLGDDRWQMALAGVSDRGVLATFESFWDAPGPWRVSFVGAGRRYTFAPLETCTVSEPGGKTRAIEPDAVDRDFKPGFHAQAVAFLAAARVRTVPEAHGLASTRPAMKLADALTRACRGEP